MSGQFRVTKNEGFQLSMGVMHVMSGPLRVTLFKFCRRRCGGEYERGGVANVGQKHNAHSHKYAYESWMGHPPMLFKIQIWSQFHAVLPFGHSYPGCERGYSFHSRFQHNRRVETRTVLYVLINYMTVLPLFSNWVDHEGAYVFQGNHKHSSAGILLMYPLKVNTDGISTAVS